MSARPCLRPLPTLLLGASLVLACAEREVILDGGTTTSPGTTESGDGDPSTTDDPTGVPSTTDDPTGIPTTTGDGDGDPTTTGGECFPVPDICLTFIDCIAALVPGQAEAVAEQYGEGGVCWCGTEDVAQDCYVTCFEQVQMAIDTNPTESACHESSCSLDELDPSQPYGPIVNGACPDYQGEAQEPFQNPFGVAGGHCAPACQGLANACPEHDQTTATGTCDLVGPGDIPYCTLRCWVDPTIIGGNQCPCGARCQPQGAPDAEGNLRGLCTFE